MFDWIWKLLYGISKSIYRIIDFLMTCANMLCGIEPVKYQGVDTDFLTFLLQNRTVSLGFVAAAIIAVVLTFIFGVAALIRTIVSEKANMTPVQVLAKVGKTLLMFIFIPICLSILVYFTNILMQALYSATLGGSTDGIGRFLAGAFGQDALKSGVPEDFYLNPSFDYYSTSSARSYMDLSDYDYFFSWVGGICIMISLGTALLQFIDRAISIVVLFIFSPISISTAVVDDGAHFKLWRDQFIVKFLTGYGCIIAINVYTIIIGAITSNGLVFFNNNLLNNFMKILIIIGGSVSMQRIMALIGNLIQSGAGSNELRDAAIAGAQMRGIASRGLFMPFRATRSAANFVRDAKQFGLGSTIGNRLGFKTSMNYGQMSSVQMGQRRQLMREREAMRRQSDASFFGSNGNTKQAIEGGNGSGRKYSSGNASNPNMSNQLANGNSRGENLVNNAINNSLNNRRDLDDLR